jgi:hypothetical protein
MKDEDVKEECGTCGNWNPATRLCKMFKSEHSAHDPATICGRLGYVPCDVYKAGKEKDDAATERRHAGRGTVPPDDAA